MNETMRAESPVAIENSADARSRPRNQRLSPTGRFSHSSTRCLIQLTFTPRGMRAAAERRA